MDVKLREKQQIYADLIVHTGVNLQPGQCLRIAAEIAHRPFVRLVVESAYRADAKFVQVDWLDTPTNKQRLLHSKEDYLDYFPEYEVGRHQYLLEQRWARLALVGPEYPHVLDGVEPARMRRAAVARSSLLNFYMNRMMANDIQWCVAAVPTRAWASQVFPDLPSDEALEALWRTVMQSCRVYENDPGRAWLEHDAKVNRVIEFMNEKRVRSVRFLDSAVDQNGSPSTDLTVGLTDRPVWMGVASETPEGTTFVANMPTEELFSTPHMLRTEGYVRITKPAFPFDRKVNDAYFRFQSGEVVEYDAAVGKDVLDELFTIDGAKRLGEVALVDSTSPINQSGLIFFETLFDENATCHIAFGNAYPDGVEGGASLSKEALKDAGVNQSSIHVDMMIGSSTMNVTGECVDGGIVSIMENGRFVDMDSR